MPNPKERQLSFDIDTVPVVNLYKYEEDRYGRQVIRFLSFKNDEEHELGETPIPGGVLKVYRTVDDARHLSYEGQSSFKYIPVGEDVELSLRLHHLGRQTYLFGGAVVSTRKWKKRGLGHALNIIRQFSSYLWQRLWKTPDTPAMYRRYYGG